MFMLERSTNEADGRAASYGKQRLDKLLGREREVRVGSLDGTAANPAYPLPDSDYETQGRADPRIARATRPLSASQLDSFSQVETISRPRRVLILDRRLDVASAFSVYLQAMGYQVATVTDSQQIVTQVRKQQPDVVLINHAGADDEPAEICRNLKQTRTTAAVPLIFITPSSDTSLLIECIRAGADDYLIKPYDLTQLHARIEMVLTRLERARQASPLTGLPGNVEIEYEVERRLHESQEFAVCYSDLANFKAFNDTYGIAHGNRVLQLTGQVVAGAVDEMGAESDFVGHVGGDDFIFIIGLTRVEAICQAIISRFDERIPPYYAHADRDRGYIIAHDRADAITRFPIMTISIAGVTNCKGSLSSFAQASAIASNIKRYLKTQHSSRYLIDRRGNCL